MHRPTCFWCRLCHAFLPVSPTIVAVLHNPDGIVRDGDHWMPHFLVSCFLGFMAVHQVSSCFNCMLAGDCCGVCHQAALSLPENLKFCVIVFYRYGLSATDSGCRIVVF